MINAVKDMEDCAAKKQEEAKKEAEFVLKQAKKEAQAIIDVMVKEAGAKAELRINFAKNSAEEIFKKKMKKCEENIEVLKQTAEGLKEQAIKAVISTIVN